MVIMLGIVISTSCRNSAILLNNSKYYYNYRMVSNTIAIYQRLKRLGFAERDIVAGTNQATFNAWANYPANTQRLEDDNIKTNLLDTETEIDLFNEDINLKRHLMAFNGRYEEGDPMNKRIEFENIENLFIYLTGHGGDKYMKIQYLEILFSRHFSDFFKDLFIRNRVKKALVISDTCSAGTLFYSMDDDVNALMIGSSAWDDYALSMGFDKYIGQPLKDKFSYHFIKKLEEIGQKDNNFSFEDFTKTFTKKLIESELLYFNKINKRKRDIELTEFLKQPKKPLEFISFESDRDVINNIFNN